MSRLFLCHIRDGRCIFSALQCLGRRMNRPIIHLPCPSSSLPLPPRTPSPLPRLPMCRIPRRMIGVAQAHLRHTQKTPLGSVPMARVARSRRWCVLASRSCSGLPLPLFLCHGVMLHASRRKKLHGVFPCPASGCLSGKGGRAVYRDGSHICLVCGGGRGGLGRRWC